MHLPPINRSLRIIYMGTPEFAVPALENLVAEGWNVVAVITAPDKPQGRGQKLVGSPVKEAAETLGIPVLQPTNLKDATFQQEPARAFFISGVKTRICNTSDFF